MSESQKCTAMSKQTGEQCKQWAVPGLTKCRFHGGAPRHARAAGQRRIAEAKAAAEVARLGARKDVHPAEALLDLVHWTAGEVDYWRARVVQLEDDALTWGRTQHREGTGPEGPVDVRTDEAKPHVAYTMLERASDRLAQYAAAALKAGVDQRRVELAERQGSLVAVAVRAILDRLDLTPEQVELVPVIVPEELRRLTDGGGAS